MTTEREVVDAYTKRALKLIRFANGLTADAINEIRDLAKEIRSELAYAGLDSIGKRELNALFNRIVEAISVALGKISESQAGKIAALIAVDAQWASAIGGVGLATDAALTRALANFTVLGTPLSDHWGNIADRLIASIKAAIRNAIVTGESSASLSSKIFGDGRRGAEKGGAFGNAMKSAASISEVATDSAAYAGRLATWKAKGVNALKWHSILDTRTTIGCAVRAGLLYDLDFQPIGHDVPIDQPPPRHWGCRSILIPMIYPVEKMPSSGFDPYSESLAQWLDRHTEEEQNAMLGVGRAKLWREGIITTRDLLNQAGQQVTLNDLK